MTVAAAVRDLLAAHGARVDRNEDLALGAGGLGLDSIAIAEVLLECETRFGVSAVELLAGPPLTVRRLIAAIGE
jgi:acyl carrier protein